MTNSNSTENFALASKDACVWHDLKNGDKKALSHIYSSYFTKLYNYGSKITSDKKLIEDSIQDIFIELWIKRESLSDVQNIKYYLFKAIRRRVIVKMNLERKQVDIYDLDSFAIELSHKSHFLNDQLSADIRGKLRQLIEHLTAKQRESIYLIYFDEMTYDQAASIMEVKVKTVYNLVSQAMARLKENKSDLAFPTLSFLIISVFQPFLHL